jgi:hypothetical protein
MDTFENYIKKKIVRKISSDSERANSLVIVAERRMFSMNENMKKIGIKEENANDYVEYCYDIIMCLIRSQMYSAGWQSSGFGAHEAEISFLRKLGFPEAEVEFANQLRYFRNGMHYYGTILNKEYAEKTIKFMRDVYPRLRKIASSKE